MIGVTGASGKTGRALISALAARGVEVRALVRREVQADEMLTLGACDARVADLEDGDALTKGLTGCRAVVHICPNMHPDEEAIGGRVFEAARRARVERVVLHSVLHPQVEAMPHHWRKLRVEERLFASGLEFTILQPTAYLQNLGVHRESVVRGGVLPLPYSTSTALAMVDLRDVAEATARVVVEPGHEHATYELCGTPPSTPAELAATFARVLGRPVRAVAVAREEWARSATESGVDVGAVADLLAMFRCYEEQGLAGGLRVLEMLLGRPARSLEDWARAWLDGGAGPDP